jgi:hypothetical protein
MTFFQVTRAIPPRHLRCRHKKPAARLDKAAALPLDAFFDSLDALYAISALFGPACRDHGGKFCG